MKKFDLEKIKEVLKTKGYKVFDNGKPYNLNIIGIRSLNAEPNKFDDTLICFYKDKNKNNRIHFWAITTDPGLYWLLNPLNVEGTAILMEGRYEGAYQLGLHRNAYQALVQRKPVKVIRDTDRDKALDFDAEKIEEGLFGINIHRAYPKGDTLTVNKYSAGCQVFENAEQFRDFMQICMMSSKIYGNYFTYTLLNERDFIQEAGNMKPDTEKTELDEDEQTITNIFSLGNEDDDGSV